MAATATWDTLLIVVFWTLPLPTMSVLSIQRQLLGEMNEHESIVTGLSLSYVDKWAESEIRFFREVVPILKKKFFQPGSKYDPDDPFTSYVTRYVVDNLALKKLENVTHPAALAQMVVANPMTTYRLTRRLAWEWPDLIVQIQEKFPKTLGLLENYLPNEDIYDSDEIKASIHTIIHLIFVYDLDIKQLANGYIKGTYTGVELSAYECFNMGLKSFQKGFFYMAFQWLELAYSRLKTDGTIKSTTVDTIMEKMINQHDYMITYGFDNPFLSFDHLLKPVIRPGPNGFSDVKLTESLKKPRDFGVRHDFIDDEQELESLENQKYLELCNKNGIRKYKGHPKLRCWLDFSTHAVFRIGPLKKEEVAGDLTQIHGLLGWKRLAKVHERLQDFLDLPKSTFYVETKDEIRTIFPTLWDVDRIIAMATGMSVVPDMNTKDIQMASYIYTGHYLAHLNSLGQTCPVFGSNHDHRGTALLFLHRPRMGGAVVFHRQRVYISPTEGSFLYWRSDTTPNEDHDDVSIFGVCPTIFGKKWAASNKLMKYKDMTFNRQCGPGSFENPFPN